MKKFQEKNLNVNLTESNVAFTKEKGSIRGLHYQTNPPQTKCIKVIDGKILDILVDYIIFFVLRSLRFSRRTILRSKFRKKENFFFKEFRKYYNYI